MPNTPLHRSFAVLYLTVGAVVLVQSIQTVLAAVPDQLPAGAQHHATVLGGAEAFAAMLFLVPRTMRRGADVLLVIFALAFVLHAMRGDLVLALAVYGAAVLFVRTHGVPWSRFSDGRRLSGHRSQATQRRRGFLTSRGGVMRSQLELHRTERVG